MIFSFFFISGYILSEIIGDELLEQLQPHRRVKRREKILPGSSTSVETSVQHAVKNPVDRLDFWTLTWPIQQILMPPFSPSPLLLCRWLFQSHDIGGSGGPGWLYDLLPDRAGHHQETPVLRAKTGHGLAELLTELLAARGPLLLD